MIRQGKNLHFRAFATTATIRSIAAAVAISIATISLTIVAQESDHSRNLKEEISVLDALDSYIFEARQAENTVKRNAGYLEAAMARQAAATTALAESRKEFESAQARLKNTLRIARTINVTGAFESMFMPDRDLESARRDALLKRLAAVQAQDLSLVAAAHEKAVAMEFVAGMERAQAWVLAKTGEDALKRLEEETAARRKLLASINDDLRMYRRRASELSEAEKAMVKTIESRLSSKIGPVNFDDMKGRMPLPLIDGTVQVPFGDVVHPRFKTVTPHPGWTMTFDSRGPRNIRNIAFGRVVWTGKMRGFGNTIVVDHASGWYSVYGGLTEFKTSEGAVVRQGDVIATVEAAPGDSSVSMYFELRRGATAVDPTEYINIEQSKSGAAK